jgi:hypothetical protein
MAKKVIPADETTRLILPETACGYEVLGRLFMQWHVLEMTDQDPEVDTRSEEEKARMHQLLDGTGI